jgi:hypothetical protein
MMAETMSQANHCFSISASTNINHPATPKIKSVILLEKANTVISQTPRTHHKIKIQDTMDEIRG